MILEVFKIFFSLQKESIYYSYLTCSLPLLFHYSVTFDFQIIILLVSKRLLVFSAQLKSGAALTFFNFHEALLKYFIIMVNRSIAKSVIWVGKSTTALEIHNQGQINMFAQVQEFLPSLVPILLSLLIYVNKKVLIPKITFPVNLVAELVLFSFHYIIVIHTYKQGTC